MNYQRIHNQIIMRAQSENRVKGCGVYYEQHHIVPKCIGGTNDKINLVLLTAREHFIVHKLLCEIYPDVYKIMYAYWRMCNNNYHDNMQRTYVVSSREYQRIREYISKQAHILSSGKKHTTETKQKIKAARATQIIKHSAETRKKISESNKGKRTFGHKHSIETKQKMSKAKLGKKYYTIQCPHCLYIGGVNNMYKWHFDQCKHKRL